MKNKMEFLDGMIIGALIVVVIVLGLVGKSMISHSWYLIEPLLSKM